MSLIHTLLILIQSPCLQGIEKQSVKNESSLNELKTIRKMKIKPSGTS